MTENTSHCIQKKDILAISAMRKPDEIEFYRSLRERAARHASGTYFGPGHEVMDLCDRIGMHHKRAFGLLIKWSNLRYIDYGMWAWGGWFEKDAPDELLVDCIPRKIRNEQQSQ